IDRLGVTGSCTCSTSNRPADSQRRTRDAEIGPNASRATEPLYGTGTARPAETAYGGSCASSSAGARTLTSCPRRISASARSCTWFCTPPGTSNEYGHTIPMRMPPPLPPHPLQHVPVLGVPPDAGLELPRQVLGHRADPVGERTGVRVGHRQRTVQPGPRAGLLVPHVRRVQRRPATQREQCRAGRHRGAGTEALHLDAAAGQVAVG